MTFEQVVTPALELAEGGFPIPDTLHRALIGAGGGLEHYDGDNQKWQSTRDVFFPGGKVLETGALLVQKELAGTFRRLIKVERDNLSGGRDKALRAARDFFYHGEIAEEMVRFVQNQGGLLTMEDLAAFHVGVDKPAAGSYKGIDVYTCGPWCQGPVSIEALQILEGCDLQAMGHNSVDYIHTVLEALKLSFADRHHFYGDPDFVDVPMEGLTSKAFADERRRAINPNRATPEMPEPGDPWRHQSGRPAGRGTAKPEPVGGRLEADTSYISVVDRQGNAFSATPSDGIGGAPVATGLGFVISPRGSQSWLDADHPCSVAPGKRPRLTPILLWRCETVRY